MTTLRVAQVTIFADHKLRVANVSLSGTGTTPKLRISGVTLTGGVTPSLRQISDQTVEALSTVTITALTGATSPTPSAYSWRQISGPTVTFQDNGSTITYTSPPAMQGAVVVFGVTAFVGAQSSLEVASVTNVIPHIYWTAGSTGWVALARPVLA